MKLGFKKIFFAVFILAAVFWVGKNTVLVKGAEHFREIRPGLFFYSEDPANGQLALLKKREGLGKIVSGAADDLEKAARLRKWAASQKWGNNVPDPYPDWNALTILDWIRSGKTGGYCGQRGIIFAQACQSFGIPVRYVDLSSKEKSGGHFVVEVWIKSLGKWVVMDPTFDVSYKRDGDWLGAREIHELLVKGKQSLISCDSQKSPRELMDLSGEYYYFRYYLRNDFLSRPVAIEIADRGNKGKELLFREERMHWNDEYTADMAFKSSRKSSDIKDFDWEFKKAGIRLKPGVPGTREFFLKVLDGREYVVRFNGKDIRLSGSGKFRLEGAGKTDVVVTGASGTCGVIFRLAPPW